LEARKGFRIFTQIKNQVMDQKEQMQLLDELMSTIQIMDELYRYHPENPTQVDVVSEFKALAERKVEIEAKLGQ
jgi:hypothetical protein